MLGIMKIFVFVVILIFVKSEDSNQVVSLTESTFNEDVFNIPHFVMFYAPWCGHCKKLTSTWNDLAKYYNLDNPSYGVTIAKVDCTQYTRICSQYEVTGYPTLKFFHPLDEEGGKRYRGDRKIEDLKEFVVQQLDETKKTNAVEPPTDLDHIVVLTEKFDDEIAEDFWFVKFFVSWCQHCKTLAPTWKELSNEVTHMKINIAEVDCTTYDFVCKQQDIEGYPTIIAYHNGKKVGGKYQGSRDLHLFKEFIAEVTSLSLTDDAADTGVGEEVVLDQEDRDFVVSLDGSSFEETIKQGVVIVEFFAPWCGHCQKLAPVWVELSAALSKIGSVTVAKVDCDDAPNKALCQKRKVTGYPTIYIYKDGVFAEEFEGPRDLDHLEVFVRKHLDSEEEVDEPAEVTDADASMDKVIALTSADFHDSITDGIWFIDFYMPWCIHCTRLAPIWSRISRDVADTDGLYMAKVDCQEEPTLCQQQNIEVYPTLVTFRDAYRFDRYGGPKQYEEMLGYVRGMHQALTYAQTKENGGVPKPKRSREPHNIVTVTEDMMRDVISSGAWFIKFYVSWCSHCKHLAPLWEEISREVRDLKGLHIGQMNCEMYKETCKIYGVDGYPTVIFFKDGLRFDVYGGPLEKGELSNYVHGLYRMTMERKAEDRKKLLEPLHLDAGNFGEVTADDWNFILFYGPNCDECDAAIDVWVSLQPRYAGRDRSPFSIVDCGYSTDICARIKVTVYPTLVLFDSGKFVEVYGGKLEEEEVFDFFTHKQNSPRDEL